MKECAMRGRIGLVFAAVLAWIAPGQIMPVWADTILHLSDTETVMAHPDELVATLRAEATASNATAAQQAVNAAMAQALARAKQIPSISAATEGYTAWQANQPQRWQASQTLMLRSHDAPPLLTLTGELQQRGLAISDLSWQLSRGALREAHDAALREAISALRSRAEDAAGLLGLHFEQFQKVSIATPQPIPFPRVMMGAALAAAAPTPPSAQAQDIPVSATAEADAVLVAK
jgi:predicted secreted protein